MTLSCSGRSVMVIRASFGLPCSKPKGVGGHCQARLQPPPRGKHPRQSRRKDRGGVALSAVEAEFPDSGRYAGGCAVALGRGGEFDLEGERVMAPPDAPGLGVTVNEEAAARHPFQQKVLQSAVYAPDGEIGRASCRERV